MRLMSVATASPHAVDLPGFGGSERRADLLSPRGMGGFMTTLIAEAGLGRPHIIAPDVGTSAALFAAAAHPERIASVIVAGNDVFCSGQIPIDPQTGKLIDGDVAAQTERVLKNLQAVLAAAGAICTKPHASSALS